MSTGCHSNKFRRHFEKYLEIILAVPQPNLHFKGQLAPTLPTTTSSVQESGHSHTWTWTCKTEGEGYVDWNGIGPKFTLCIFNPASLSPANLTKTHKKHPDEQTMFLKINMTHNGNELKKNGKKTPKTLNFVGICTFHPCVSLVEQHITGQYRPCR